MFTAMASSSNQSESFSESAGDQEAFKGGKREKEPALLQKQPNKEKKGWQGAESEIGEQLKQKINNIGVFSESTDSKRERKLQKRRKGERTCCASETADEREAKLSKRRIKDRARHAAHTVRVLQASGSRRLHEAVFEKIQNVPEKRM